MEDSRRFGSVSIKGFILFYALYCILLIKASITTFLRYFPNGYSASELFISYSGGFIRRGLIGTILYALFPYVSLQYLIIVGYITVFVVFLVASYRSLSKNFDILTVLFILSSPAYFLFHLKVSSVFARKDILIQFFVFISYGIAVWSVLNEKRKILWPTLLLLSLYIVSFLIHEMTLFYFPLPFALLGVAFQRRNKLLHWVIIGAVVVSASLAVAYLFGGTIAQRSAICAAWQRHYPTLSCAPPPEYAPPAQQNSPDFVQLGAAANAISYIGANLADNIRYIIPYYQNPVTLGSALYGVLLALLPLAFICAGYNSLRSIKIVVSSLMLRIFFWIAVCIPWALALIANDFGRHTSSACLSYLFFLLSMQRIAPQPCQDWLRKLNARFESSSRYQWIILSVLLIYGFGWMLNHWVPIGKSFISLDPLVHAILR